ncbi:hypothetical protein Nepgr_029551 [Nepenthes gracilis]|uniref:Myb-like domain-containing protein n=1 Tax=Nepenthes gracilis TaxID=150966 RepID=A0AAD3TCN3_NEPGR|nr:hypothetical protein Nepgr_029551 [Nepenthes gracilis]
MADEVGSSSVMREYRKGNWTLQEIIVLVEAKRMDDERRVKRQISGDQSKPTELRWKWVENYCWKNGCFRSQNQCNDKWDNLMRDYKKVRDYQRRLGADHDINPSSYWNMEKAERKDKSLPPNMSFQIYQALVEVVGRNSSAAGGGGGGGAAPRTMLAAAGSDVVGGSASAATGTAAMDTRDSGYLTEMPISSVQPPLPPIILQHNASASMPALLPPSPHLPPLPLQPPLPPSQPPIHFIYSQSQPSPPIDSDTSDHSDSPENRRKRRRRSGGGGDGQGTTTATPLEEVSSEISRSASMIAEAIQTREERAQKRHRELLSLHERRLKIEESMAEINREGISSLVQAINNLVNSILTLANSHHNQPPSPK